MVVHVIIELYVGISYDFGDSVLHKLHKVITPLPKRTDFDRFFEGGFSYQNNYFIIVAQLLICCFASSNMCRSQLTRYCHVRGNHRYSKNGSRELF